VWTTSILLSYGPAVRSVTYGNGTADIIKLLAILEEIGNR